MRSAAAAVADYRKAHEDCPALTTTCLANTCTGGCCGTANAPDTTACTDDGGKVCDGSGACVACNVRKGGRTPKQAHLSLIRKPEKPKRSPLLNLKMTHKKYQSWKTFLDNAYWSVELK